MKPLRILALDASVGSGTVAALEGERVLAERVLDGSQKTARPLAPALAELLREVGWRPREVELVAVGVGPGSFTGLRIAVTTAKTIAYALGCPILGVGTLRAIAAQVPGECDEIQALLDAQRMELFVQTFARHRTSEDSAGELIALGEPEILAASDWLAKLSARPAARIAVTGPGLARVRHAEIALADRLIDPALWVPRASTIGRLAQRDYLAGRRDDPFTLAPIYLRPSYAEEKRR